jgi:hypothetical protein
MMDLETINYVNERDSDNRLAEVRGESPIARFFVYNSDQEDAPIYVVLATGESRSFHYKGDHEEGWWSRQETYEFDGVVVRSYIETDGTDCDGRMQNFSEYHCAVSNLATFPGWYNGRQDDTAPRMPAWESGPKSQRDHTAEAAGY